MRRVWMIKRVLFSVGFFFLFFCEWIYIPVCGQSGLVSTCWMVKFPHSPRLTHITQPSEQIMSRKLDHDLPFYLVSSKGMWVDDDIEKTKQKTKQTAPVSFFFLYPPSTSICCRFLNKLLSAPLNCATCEKLWTNTGIERDVICLWVTHRYDSSWAWGGVPVCSRAKTLYLEAFKRRMRSRRFTRSDAHRRVTQWHQVVRPGLAGPHRCK